MINAFSETITQSDIEFEAMAFEMCEGTRDAAFWICQVVELATHWDHVQDGDPLDKDRFRRVLSKVLSEWPRNEFYRKHCQVLAPVLLNAILAWESSDTDPLLRIKAYDVATEVPTAVALCLGGESMARQWSPRWRLWAVNRCRDNDRKDTPCQQ